MWKFHPRFDKVRYPATVVMKDASQDVAAVNFAMRGFLFVEFNLLSELAVRLKSTLHILWLDKKPTCDLINSHVSLLNVLQSYTRHLQT